ncbi:Veg family protein [Vagococcus sp.]|uniref:Veg family protein n=1 Tax=Vagococcus sp. TaxID=1933889 RepID=UPI003F96B51E
MAHNIASIKEGLKERVGSRLTLTSQVGRKRQSEHSGVLTETYPAVFVVDLDQSDHAVERVSYSYADVLTHSIELAFVDEEEPLFG